MNIDSEIQKLLEELTALGADKIEMDFWSALLPSLNDKEKEELSGNLKSQSDIFKKPAK
jgi:hypothetical protein